MLNPNSSHRIFNHITDNPVRCKQLSCCRDSFFCDFHVLFQLCKGVIFQFRIVILIQPSNDFHLSGWITFFIQCRYIKVSFWNTCLRINQHIDDIIFIGIGNTKQQFHIIGICLKQSWEDIMQLMTLFQE